MDRIDRKILRTIINKIDSENKEQLTYMLKLSIESFIKSLIVFGTYSDITKDTIKIYKEVRQIINEETSIHRFIKKNALQIEIRSAFEFLDELDELNEKTIRHYYKLLDDILTSCDLKNELYAKRINKDFETLIETDIYKEKAACLLISLQDLKQTLGFEEEFWKYIEERITFSNLYDKINFDIHSILNNNNEVIDFKVILPCITNYESKEKCVELLKKSYQLYLQINRSNKSDDDINSSSERVKKYILNRFNQ